MKSELRLGQLKSIVVLGMVACGGSSTAIPMNPEDGASSEGTAQNPTAPTESSITIANPPTPAADVSTLRIQTADGRSWFVDGRADDASSDLSSLPGHNAFWFAWSVFHPGTEIYGRDQNIAEASIEADSGGQCSVPCDDIIPGCPGRDCIPPLDSPKMSTAGADDTSYLADEDIVLGVITTEGPRAYPHNILWWHEVANEEVGEDAFAVTLCPLTGSGLVFDRRGFVDGQTVRLGVSGLLYNSNLVMWDRETETLWSQMRLEGVQGQHLGSPSPLRPVLEMSWRAWKALHPDTLVISEDAFAEQSSGGSRNYQSYPYIRGGSDYRSDHGDTFRQTSPAPDSAFANKDMVFGLVMDGERRAYHWGELFEKNDSAQGVINDDVGGTPIAIVYDLSNLYVHAFERSVDGETVELAIETR